MEIRTSFLIKPVIKALIDVVSPAIDQNNKLAAEQLQLSIAALKFLEEVMALEFRYDRFELEKFIELGEILRVSAAELPVASSEAVALARCIDHGKDVLRRAMAEPGELIAANNELRSRIGILISAAAAGAPDGGSIKTMNAAVMKHAKDQILRERAWVSAQGWEAGSKLPAIETLIGTVES